MGVGDQRHASTALPPGQTRYPLYRRLGGPQGRSGRMQKISSPPGFDPRTVQPVAGRYTTELSRSRKNKMSSESGMSFMSYTAIYTDPENNNNNNNNNNIYLLQLGCHPVAVVILHVNKT